MHENLGLQHDAYVSSDEILERVGRIGELAPGRRTGRQRPGPLLRLSTARSAPSASSRPLSHEYCDRCNRVRLTADGRLRLCLFGDHAVDLRAPLRAGASTRELADLLRSRDADQARTPSPAVRRGRLPDARLLRNRRLSQQRHGRRAALSHIKGTAGMDEVYLRTDEAASRRRASTRWCASTRRSSRGILRRMVGDAEAALDLTQDVFLAAFRMLKADPNRELTAGWLYRAATNGAISFMRRREDLADAAARSRNRSRRLAARRAQRRVGRSSGRARRGCRRSRPRLCC